MAVTIDSQIDQYFTWGSYPYATWGGNEFIGWGTAGYVRTTLTDEETIPFHESIANAIPKQITKISKAQLGLKDTFSRNTINNRTIAETIKLSETYWDEIQFKLKFIETFGFEEKTLNKVLDKKSKETFEINEKYTRSFVKLTNENLNATDTLNKEVLFNRFANESFAITDAYKQSYSCYQDELFAINEYAYREPKKVALYNLKLQDGFARKTITNRLLIDKISLADKSSKLNTKKLYEKANIKDVYLKQCIDAIYSNIFITEGDFSDSDFKDAINKAPGYTKFIDFKVGEYEYKDALVRITVEAGPQTQPTVSDVVMHVDIPDTDDRGTVQITNTSGATPVEFHKLYYTVPEVQVTLKGANTSQGTVIPNITNITTTHFYVELLTSGGARTTGTISWVSKGY